VRITCIVGRLGQEEGEGLVADLRAAAADLASRLGLSLDDVATRLESVQAHLGDGVVPVESALCPGAEDVVLVDASHRGLLRTIEIEQAARRRLGGTQETPPAIPIIIDRLAAPAGDR
jgi:hypothetical protein